MKNTRTHLGYKTFLALIAIIWSTSLLSGIGYVTGSGNNINNGSAIDRDRNFAYHTGSDDQHWFGTDKWAVRFNFAAIYPTYSNARFIINQAQLYFPIVQSAAPFDSVQIEIWSDFNGLVQTRKYLSGKTAVTTNTMNIDIPASELDTLGVAWLVVNYITGVAGPFVSASTGDGTHSYYWNTNVPTNPYFQNMANAGYASEFLFGVRGRFELSDTDLELFSADLNPTPVMNGRATPSFTIINNSGLEVTQVSVNITLSTPDSLFNPIQDIVQIVTPIPPYGELTVVSNDPLYPGHTYQLPNVSTQVKFKAVLHSQYDAADTLFNNTIEKYYSCFNRSMPINMVENFILTGEQSAGMLAIQDTIITNDIKILNYFPVPNDIHFSPGAAQRFIWYDFTGLPMTVLNGARDITGFYPDYDTAFSDAMVVIHGQTTFLENVGTTVSLPTPPNQLLVRATFRNSSSYVFDSIPDPSILRQSRFFSALFQKVTLYGEEKLIFQRWGAYADTINTAMVLNESYTRQFSISLQDIPQENLSTDYLIYYWIQHPLTKQIIYANYTDLTNVANEDDTNPVTRDKLIIAPNPARLGKALSVILPDKYKTEQVKLTVYNLKGQIVYKENVSGHTIQINTAKFPSAGIYLLKVSAPSSNGNFQLTKRLVIY